MEACPEVFLLFFILNRGLCVFATSIHVSDLTNRLILQNARKLHELVSQRCRCASITQTQRKTSVFLSVPSRFRGQLPNTVLKGFFPIFSFSSQLVFCMFPRLELNVVRSFILSSSQ
jgi:hypothetical protein